MNDYMHVVVPPGFRFHPTDEELVDYYLRRKISSQRIDLDVIKDVDLYKIEPWDLQELCRIGTEEQSEWYFFSHKDKKYPTGTRTNRATAAGFWKATGRDKSIYSNNKHELIGMRKTLVFYKGRAPNGHKSDWIMHEYRLETDENGTPQEEGWVVCRVFKKRITTVYNDDRASFMHVMEELPKQHVHHNVQLLHNNSLYNDPAPHKKEIDRRNLRYYNNHIVTPSPDHFLQLPLLESPKMPSFGGMKMNPEISNLPSLDHYQNYFDSMKNDSKEQCGDQLMDWKVFDSFVASQLGDDLDIPKESVAVTFRAGEESNLFFRDSNNDNKVEMVHQENALASSSSSCQYDVWN